MISISEIFNSVAFAQDASQSTSPVAVLGLNWELFIAQLINFAVILFILWKWVFTPVAKKLQERTDRIEKAMSDANTTEKEQQKMVEDGKKQIEQEKNQQLQAAKGELADMITNATEKIIRQKLDKTKDQELIKEVLKSI